MKRAFLSLLVAALAIAGSGVASAQGFSYGAKAGLNISTAHDYDDADWIPGFVGGVFLDYGITRELSVQPEVLFSMKGTESDANNVKTDVALYYIEVPVLAKYTVPLNGMVSPFLYAGPAISFKVYDDATIETSGVESDMTEAQFDPKWGAVSIAVGGGVEIMKNISLDARYTYDFTEFADSNAGYNGKNGVFSICLGYAF